MSKPTMGPWTHEQTYHIDKDYGRIPHIVQSGREPSIAVMSEDLVEEVMQANAELIVRAVNACHAVCPSDPLAAAEAYPAIVEALVALRDDSWRHTVDWGPREEREAIEARCDEALAKIGRK